ncbi:MAG: ATP-dependent Clp protease ATP-binding subunit [Candidatus Hydrogenedentota bacterium]
MQVSVSPEISGLLDDAAALSARRGLPYVGVEHLFEMTVEKTAGLPRVFAEQYFRTFNTIVRELHREAWQGVLPVAGRDVFYTPRCAAVLNEAGRIARRMGHASPGGGHVLMAMLADPHGAPARAMDRLQLNRGAMLNALRDGLLKMKSGGPDRPRKDERSQQAQGDSEEASERFTSPLEGVTRDLTKAAREGRIGPVIGRDREIGQVLEILSRKGKNNAMLVGEPGVGKTQIVEGMALAGSKGKGGEALSRYRFLELNIASLTSGTQYRGAFEEKVSELLEVLKHSRNIILFIDEIHLIMGVGSAGGGAVDLANLLKPALARGEIRCIGATTLEEYRKCIEKDSALDRRFQMVRVEPLSQGAAWEVLNQLRPSYEKHHGVRISRKALHAAITLTTRYMPARYLPDKAIDVVDQACARRRLYEVATKNRPDMFEHGAPLIERDKVTPHDIRKVVSQMSGVPIEEITAEERQRLEGLEQKFKQRIIGQDEAVSRVVAAAKKSRAGLADPNRPDAVLFFLGPTGVGKTQMAKTLADYVFGSEAHLITFDMSEYSEAHSVSRLVGAPPGYVGYGEEGQLTEAVRNRPFSVLLFDEIEKAHSKVFDVLLPLLDEGRLKDSVGRLVNFRNCMVIFTSNIGADILNQSASKEVESQELLDALKKHFRPEFINRIDEIAPFRPLLFEDIRSILASILGELEGRLKSKGIGLHVYQGAYEHLAQKGYNPAYGARELRRTVERLVINPISAMVVEEQFRRGSVVEVLMVDDELTFREGQSSERERKGDSS